MLEHLKSLAKQSAVYSLGKLATRALGFFLIPLYTRFLTPDDYGILAVVSSISSVLYPLFTLSLNASVVRHYFDYDDEEGRREHAGTLFTFLMIIALAFALGLSWLGRPLFALIAPELAFEPYVMLAIWSTYFTMASVVPLALYRAQQRPGWYSVFSVATFLANVGFTIYYVVGLRQGALGSLRGSFFASALIAVGYLFFIRRDVKLGISWDKLRPALAFSLPLVPRGLIDWAKGVADRLIMQRYVPMDDVGRYSLGYQFGTVMYLVNFSVNSALTPFIYRILEQTDKEADRLVARLTTYYYMVISFLALAVTLLSREAIIIMAAPDFREAYAVVPPIVFGFLMTGLGYLPTTLLYLEKQTQFVSAVTIVGAVVSLAANFLTIPRWGTTAAAYATLASSTVMFLLSSILAYRVHPLPIETKRLGHLMLILGSALGIGLLINGMGTTWRALMMKIALLAFVPLALIATNFCTASEKRRILSVGKSMLRKLGWSR